jgi:hypothetical protein
VSDVDDLVAALIKGDPTETVPLEIVTAMARSAIRAFWIPCPHTNFITLTERNYDDSTVRTFRTCERCGARLVVEPEDTDG